MARASNASIAESVYTTQVQPISAKPIGAQVAKPQDVKSIFSAYSEYPKINHAGYLITKIEVLQNGTYEERGKMVTDNPDGLYIVDKNIRYGGVYVYEVKSVYHVELLAEERNVDDPSCDELALVEILIASEGNLASVRCTESIPPPPPTNIRVGFDYKTRKPRVTWQFPVNPQRDIKRFQVFKRMSVREPFKLIKEFDFDNSTIRTNVTEVASEKSLYRLDHPQISCIDNEWESGQKPIYTVACVDAHALSSNFCSQMRFIYDKRLNKVRNELVSFPGAPKPYPNLLLNEDSFQDAIKVSGYDRMRVYLEPEFYKVSQFVNKDPNVERDLDF